MEWVIKGYRRVIKDHDCGLFGWLVKVKGGHLE
jgi:hypothetical protein